MAYTQEQIDNYNTTHGNESGIEDYYDKKRNTNIILAVSWALGILLLVSIIYIIMKRKKR